MHTQEQNRLIKFVLLAVILGFTVIMLGAFTRLKHAGLGCPDWPGCYGHLTWPSSADEIIKANINWPDAKVQTDKTWPEMVHRYFASILGLLSIVISYLSIKNRQKISISPVVPSAILVLIVIQGLFGMWTVTLKLWPQVVVGHLLGGFASLSLFWLLLQMLSEKKIALNEAQRKAIKKILPLIVCMLLAVVLQIALGGWTTSNYAALACPDLPRCHGRWWPEMSFIEGFNLLQTIGPNYLGGIMDNNARVAIHVSHRIGAVVNCFLIFVGGFYILKISITELHAKIFALWAVLAVQILLGISNVLFDFPLAIAVAHNAVGALLLLKVISLLYAAYQYAR